MSIKENTILKLWNTIPLKENMDEMVNSPPHYKYGKKETIDVIKDCMTNDEYHGYLKGNVLKYISLLQNVDLVIKKGEVIKIYKN